MLPRPVISSAFHAALAAVVGGVNSAEGRTATMAGEYNNRQQRKRESATMADIASSTEAKSAPRGAGAGIKSAKPSLWPSISAPGTTSPLDTAKLASIVASASTTPESANAFWCAEVLHNRLTRLAARRFCSCTTVSADCWERMAHKASRERGVKRASDKPLASSGPEGPSWADAVMLLKARKAVSTTRGWLSSGDRCDKIAGTAPTA